MIPALHLEELIREHNLGCPVELITEQEAAWLRKYGLWCEALASGKMSPITDTQMRFVRVAQGSEQAETEFERLWIKY